MADQQDLLPAGPSTRRPSTRRENDVYLTPSWCTQVLIDRVPEMHGTTLLDPCCGDGRMAAQLMDTGRFSEACLNDIDPACGITHLDACAPAIWWLADHGGPDWSVTNPPFNAAGDIARTALAHSTCGVALLLRSTWLEPCGASPKAPRGERRWLVETPPTRLILLGRVAFLGGGATDSAPCAWFIWLRDETGGWQRGGIEVADGASGRQLTIGGGA